MLGQETDYDLARLGFAGGEILVPARDDLVPGRRLRLRIHARDVSLSLKPPYQSSILNSFPVRVLDAPVSLTKRNRPKPDDMAIIVEDLVKLLDKVGGDLRRGHYPNAGQGTKVAAILRKVADDLDA